MEKQVAAVNNGKKSKKMITIGILMIIMAFLISIFGFNRSPAFSDKIDFARLKELYLSSNLAKRSIGEDYDIGNKSVSSPVLVIRLPYGYSGEDKDSKVIGWNQEDISAEAMTLVKTVIFCYDSERSDYKADGTVVEYLTVDIVYCEAQSGNRIGTEQIEIRKVYTPLPGTSVTTLHDSLGNSYYNYSNKNIMTHSTSGPSSVSNSEILSAIKEHTRIKPTILISILNVMLFLGGIASIIAGIKHSGRKITRLL